MKKLSRQWLWTALLIVAPLATSGCTPGSIGFLMALGQDALVAPECPLAKPGKEIKVVVVADAGMKFEPELNDVDKHLSARLVETLRESYKVSKEKVEVVPAFKVEAFKQRQLDWRNVSPQEIGKHFGADYVINLDIIRMSLFEEKTRQLYRGRAEICVKVLEMNAPEGEGVKFSKDFICPEYPRVSPVDVGGLSVSIFREQFLRVVAEEISHSVSSYPAERKHNMR
jgi:hypothetical protein